MKKENDPQGIYRINIVDLISNKLGNSVNEGVRNLFLLELRFKEPAKPSVGKKV
jgi:hypothetical protein